MKGTLYLIPTPLGKRKENVSLPEETLRVARSLKRFVVENVRSAQSFLQWIGHPLRPHEIEFRVLNRKTPEHEVYGFLGLLRSGDTGLLSEAGAPAVADPGSVLVRMAHEAGHRVVPLPGPSSPLLALMASGLDGQRFTFHGYLPREREACRQAIREMERESQQTGRTQIFMETPFRNNALLNLLLESCDSQTRLCVAADLTMPGEQVSTQRIEAWRSATLPDLNGIPALFLLSAPSML